MKLKEKTPKSTSIDGYEYDPDTQHLDVKFKSGVDYRYLEVDRGTFDKLQLAESKGNFIATEIKKFKAEKLGSLAAWPFPTGAAPK